MAEDLEDLLPRVGIFEVGGPVFDLANLGQPVIRFDLLLNVDNLECLRVFADCLGLR